MAKLYDVTIKTGEYTDNSGQTKGRYTKIGVVMSGSDGGQFMLLEPQVDIAGCLMLQNNLAVAKGQPPRDSVMCSMFAPNEQGGQPMPQPTQPAPQPTPQQQPQPMMQPQQPQMMPQQQPQMAGAQAGFNNNDAPF